MARMSPVRLRGLASATLLVLASSRPVAAQTSSLSAPGLCAGVRCVAADACHPAGSCHPATGACSNPVALDGTPCNDGNPCTRSDACRGGA